MIYHCNFSKWNQIQAENLLKTLSLISNNEFEKNIISAVHNPILAIVLSCEILRAVGNSHRFIRHACKEAIQNLKVLVQKIIESIEDLALLEKMLTELDS